MSRADAPPPAPDARGVAGEAWQVEAVAREWHNRLPGREPWDATDEVMRRITVNTVRGVLEAADRALAARAAGAGADMERRVRAACCAMCAQAHPFDTLPGWEDCHRVPSPGRRDVHSDEVQHHRCTAIDTVEMLRRVGVFTTPRPAPGGAEG